MLYTGKKDPWDCQPIQETRWKLFFDCLVDDGLCLPSKRDTLLDWPSTERRGALNRAIDDIASRFGRDALRRGGMAVEKAAPTQARKDPKTP